MTSEKITLQIAAKALKVSVRTVQRYIDKGLLTKVKNDGRVYVMADEIRSLRQKSITTHDTTYDNAKTTKGKATVDVSYLESLLIQLGEYKEKQRLLIEYQNDIRQKDMSLVAKEKEITEIKANLANKGKELFEVKAIISTKELTLEETKKQNKQLEEENIRLQKSLAEEIKCKERLALVKEREIADWRSKYSQSRKEISEFREKPWWKKLLFRE